MAALAVPVRVEPISHFFIEISGIFRFGNIMRMTSKSAALQAGYPAIVKLAIMAALLALLAIPRISHAQGIIGGARDGSREGNRIAGPVGGVVGGAIGAGVGGAVGGVKGVLGIPDRGYRAGYQCRGYYTRSGVFRCYR